MKLTKIASVFSIGLLLASCSNSTTSETKQDLQTNELDGEMLMEKNCLTCHGNGTSHDNILAPPMKGVKNHYLTDDMTENEFIDLIVNWVSNPTEENAKMPGAVNRFGVMPKQDFNQDEVKAIATYIFNNDMPKPQWFDQHMKDQHGEQGFVIDGLELNNGNKWKANPETTEGINNMISLVENMSEQPTVEEYQNLGLELEKEKKYILNQCTMKGVAHDNLHQYLMPLIRRINGIKEVESVERGNKIYTYIKNHLNAYTDYFE